MQPHRQAGFTLIELVVAMALFTFTLLIIVGGFINVVRVYRSGIASRSTQHNSRFGVEEIVRASRNYGDAAVRLGLPATPGGNFDVLCLGRVGEIRRFYVNNITDRFLVSDKVADCGALLNSSAQRITSDDVMVSYFHVSTTTGSPKTVDIGLGTASVSAHTLLTSDGTACDAAAGASEFCNVTGLQTTVSLRGQRP